MGKYIVLKPIYEADQRLEKGSVIDLTEERAAQIGAEYVAPEVATVPASPVEGAEDEEESDEESEDGAGDGDDSEESEDSEESNEE